MNIEPRFHVGDVVEFDAPEDYHGAVPREPFTIEAPPARLGQTYRYSYRGWYYPEKCLRLVESPVDVDVGGLL